MGRSISIISLILHHHICSTVIILWINTNLNPPVCLYIRCNWISMWVLTEQMGFWRGLRTLFVGAMQHFSETHFVLGSAHEDWYNGNTKILLTFIPPQVSSPIHKIVHLPTSLLPLPVFQSLFLNVSVLLLLSTVFPPKRGNDDPAGYKTRGSFYWRKTVGMFPRRAAYGYDPGSDHHLGVHKERAHSFLCFHWKC